MLFCILLHGVVIPEKLTPLSSQEITHILWNPNVHYRIYKRLSSVPIQSQLDPVHALHSLLEDPF
jgi:hypothetical protein